MAKQQPSKKQQTRADRFWSSFLFTENGKPKSGFFVYIISLSFVFLIVYALCFEGAMRLLTGLLSGLPNSISNCLISLIASLVGAVICCLPQRFFRDKRLVFGGHICLVAYLLIAIVTMLLELRGESPFTMLAVLFWFAVIPTAVGTTLSGLLCFRDLKKMKPKEPQAEWQKYINTH